MGILSMIKDKIVGGAGVFFVVLLFEYSALAVYTTCPDCYKCVWPNPSGGCYQCEYDESYCSGEVVDCPIGKKWDEEQQKCVCDPYPVCVIGETVNEETCECEGEAIHVCQDGFYWNDICLACPIAVDFDVVNTSDVCGGPHTAEGNRDYSTSCFYGGGEGCKYENTRGTFVFVDSCYYADDSGDTGVVDGSEVVDESEVIEFP